MRDAAMGKQSYQTSIETQSHPLITLVTWHE